MPWRRTESELGIKTGTRYSGTEAKVGKICHTSFVTEHCFLEGICSYEPHGVLTFFLVYDVFLYV